VRQSISVAVFDRAGVTSVSPVYSGTLEFGGFVAREGLVLLTGGYVGAVEAGHLPPRLLVLVGPGWERFAETLSGRGTVEENLLQ